MNWKYSDDKKRVVLEGGKPAKTKKLTGTRFAAALGYNTWKSPFEIWCEITKLAAVPFEGSIYTEAGKAIEPILIDWSKDEIAPYIQTPEEFFGNSFGKGNIKYDYYPEVKRIGGMWDGLVMKGRKSNEPIAVIECKTTKRSEDWQDGVPTYYALQGLLYAYLCGVDEVYFPVAFLTDRDYDHPEKFVPTTTNTTFFRMTVSDYRLNHNGTDMTFQELYAAAEDWLHTYIDSGVSPEFDEVVDKDILKIVRATQLDVDNDVYEIATQCNRLADEIERIYEESGLKDLEKQFKAAKDALKRQIVEQMDPKDKSASVSGWEVTRSFRKGVDKEALKADGLLDKYETETTVETLKKVKGN